MLEQHWLCHLKKVISYIFVQWKLKLDGLFWNCSLCYRKVITIRLKILFKHFIFFCEYTRVWVNVTCGGRGWPLGVSSILPVWVLVTDQSSGLAARTSLMGHHAGPLRKTFSSCVSNTMNWHGKADLEIYGHQVRPDVSRAFGRSSLWTILTFELLWVMRF